ncbi:MAG: NTP transferase domain-containing protein [Nanoarchaeota archaeon]|nr:NTP transferase domain-containing protein [Nanoarchaeota archaeon]MBU1135733.1 NTP transferase domain-containing protein [Nanoarchaeota archaeon]MBU2520098.1 NTP transferase domain-containing protein [Nanoarchaeota archaeon]
MQSVILAAGKSTRTYPLTLNKPKVLLPIANKPLLQHNLEQLKQLKQLGNVTEIIIVVGFEKEQIMKQFGNSFDGIPIRYVEQKEQLGTAHALIQAKEYISDSFIVMNGDDLYSHNDMERCIKSFEKHDACVLAQQADNPERFGVYITDNGLVKDIVEKPKTFVSNLINVGFYILNKSALDIKIDRSPRGEYEITDIIKKLAENGKVYCETVKDYWIPVGYPWNLLDANAHLLKYIENDIQGEVESNATIKGNVKIGKGTLVKNGAYIEGPVVIGEKCNIGPNCFIRENTTIGNNCKIGNGVEIKNSIIMNNVAVCHLSYIGDSVIGNNVNIGAGNVTANLRHDNKNVKTPVGDDVIDSGRRKLGAVIAEGVHTGINTTIYPGRKIWPNKTTMPGEIVKSDIK